MNQSILQIKKHFSIIPHSSCDVELRSGVWNPTAFMIHDESNMNKLFDILKDINGEHETKDIAARHQVSSATVEGVLDYLTSLDVLEYPHSSTENAFIGLSEQSRQETGSSLLPLLLVGDDTVCQEISRIVTRAGFRGSIKTMSLQNDIIKHIKSNSQWSFDYFMMQETEDKCSEWKDHFIVLALSQNDPILSMRINQIAHHLGISWIHGVIDGPFLFIGPTFFPNKGCCYQCFEQRVAMNLREYASYQRYKETMMQRASSVSDAEASYPLMHLLSSHLAMEIICYQRSKSCFTQSKVLSIYLPTMEICFNEVLRLSGCAVCGSHPHRDDQQLYYDYQAVLEKTL